MAKGLYIGVSSKARKPKSIYVGGGNIAKKIKKMYLGDTSGKARTGYEGVTKYFRVMLAKTSTENSDYSIRDFRVNPPTSWNNISNPQGNNFYTEVVYNWINKYFCVYSYNAGDSRLHIIKNGETTFTTYTMSPYSYSGNQKYVSVDGKTGDLIVSFPESNYKIRAVINNGTIKTTVYINAYYATQSRITYINNKYIYSGNSTSSETNYVIFNYTSDPCTAATQSLWQNSSSQRYISKFTTEEPSIVYYNNKYYAISIGVNSGSTTYFYLISSSDLSSWTLISTGSIYYSSQYDYPLFFKNGEFFFNIPYARNQYSTITSTGIWKCSVSGTWTKVTSTLLGTNTAYVKCGFDGEKYVVCAQTSSTYSSKMLYSTDGATWTQACTTNFYALALACALNQS